MNNITELKMEMVEIIAQTYDEPMVNRIYEKIHEAIEGNDAQNGDVTDESWWDEVPAEQQQRILRQVEAARQAKRAKEKDKQHQPEGLRVLTHAASSNPPTEITDSTGMTKTLSTNAKIKHRVHNIHNNNMSSDDQQHQHHYFDDTTTRAARRAHQRERPPRTKGLLYQRQPNGTLVPMDRPHIGRH